MRRKSGFLCMTFRTLKMHFLIQLHLERNLLVCLLLIRGWYIQEKVSLFNALWKDVPFLTLSLTFRIIYKCILNNFICRAIEELSFGDVYFHCFTFLRIFLNDPLFSLSLKISSSILINKEPVISFKCQFVVQSDIARECDWCSILTPYEGCYPLHSCLRNVWLKSEYYQQKKNRTKGVFVKWCYDLSLLWLNVFIGCSNYECCTTILFGCSWMLYCSNYLLLVVRSFREWKLSKHLQN